jgi:hypothetical protein
VVSTCMELPDPVSVVVIIPADLVARRGVAVGGGCGGKVCVCRLVRVVLRSAGTEDPCSDFFSSSSTLGSFVSGVLDRSRFVFRRFVGGSTDSSGFSSSFGSAVDDLDRRPVATSWITSLALIAAVRAGLLAANVGAAGVTGGCFLLRVFRAGPPLGSDPEGA